MTQRRICRECACALPLGAGARGYCPECLASEAPELHPDVRASLEETARTACRDAGLALHRFPCALSEPSPQWPEGRCGPCWRERNAKARALPPIPPSTHYRGAEFTDIDAEHLRRYFSRARAEGIGSMGGFGAMIQRVGESTNSQTTERPSRTEAGCPVCHGPLTNGHRHTKALSVDFANRRGALREYETRPGVFRVVKVYPATIDPEAHESQLIDAHASHGVGHVGSWDDQAVDLTQDGRFRQKVRDTLARISAKAFGILEARYSGQDAFASRGAVDPRIGELAHVALLTPALAKHRAAEAQAGHAAGGRDLLSVLTKDAAGGQGKEARTLADGTLRAIRADAMKLVAWAQEQYARAASQVL